MDIKIKEELEDEILVQKCGICGVNVYKYVCPRCNILYCSVSCYKAQMHLDCSESFYKESIEAELKVQGRDPDAKKRMEEILRRVDQEPDFDSDDSDDVDDLSERLTGVDLNDAESVWDKLTEEERKEFMELVRNGDATDLVPTWEPWWSSKHPVPKVLELGSSSHKNYKNQCPKLRNVPNLSLITKTEPSPLVYFNLVNILSGYTFIMRYYNGNFENLILEAVTIYLDLTKNLMQTFDSIDSAFASIGERANANPWVEISQENISQMKEDVFKILEGPNEDEADFYVRAALSDIHVKLSSAKKMKPKNSKPASKFEQYFPEANVNNMNFVTKDVLNKCIKKIEYLESWTLERYLSINTQNV